MEGCCRLIEVCITGCGSLIACVSCGRPIDLCIRGIKLGIIGCGDAVVEFQRRISYQFSPNKSKIRSLKILLSRLEEVKSNVSRRVKVAAEYDEEIKLLVRGWLIKSSDILSNGYEIYRNKSRAEIESRLDQIVEMVKQGELLDEVGLPSSFNEIMKALNVSNVHVIGMWALNGVGIQRLVNKVVAKAKQEKLFDKVVQVTISINQDEKQIQQQLGRKLNVNLMNDALEIGAVKLHERIKKEDRILFILDDIQSEVNLESVGIPIGDDHKGCKILLTSRNSNVSTWKMGVQKIVLLNNLRETETLKLFQGLAGYHYGITNSFAERIVRILDITKQERLPTTLTYAILDAAVAMALRNSQEIDLLNALRWLEGYSNLVSWVNPYSKEDPFFFNGNHNYISFILELCYNNLESEEAKSLFLLIGLVGHSCVSKYHLFQLGMGLQIFKQVNTLEDGRNRLQKLIYELNNACLLLEDEGACVKMHDMIREGVVAIASKNQEVFFQKNGSNSEEWPDIELLPRCHKIFKPFSYFDHLPPRLKAPELQLLMMGLHDDLDFQRVPEGLFEHTKKLLVLDLKGHFIFASSFHSLSLLKNLRSLSLSGCHLTNTAIVGELTNLQILNLNGSNIKILTKEFGQLHHLKLLDLENSSICEIAPQVLSNLESLEELYMGGTNICWGISDKNNESTKATLDELGTLNHLTSLDLTVPNFQAWPTNMFFKSLLKFQILVGDLWPWNGKDLHQILKLQYCRNIHLGFGMKALLKEVKHLVLNETPSFKNVQFDLNANGNSELKYLIIDDLAHPSFPNLISLGLHNLSTLECICNGPLIVNSFCKLRILKVTCCDRMKNLIYFSMIKVIPQLIEIEVSKCNSMEGILLLEEENVNQYCIGFSCLQSLVVHNLPLLIGFCCKEMKSSTSQKICGKQIERQTLHEITEEHNSTPFFNEKVLFPKLDTLHLSSLNFNNLWGDQLFGATSNIQNLTKLNIEEIRGLKHLFSICMSMCLLKLKHLEIKNCIMMEDIFFIDKAIVETNNHTRDGSNKKIFFPSLTIMIVHCMENLKTMWHCQLATQYSFGKLKTIKIKNCPKLIPIFPTYIVSNLKGLHDLSVENCNLSEDIANLPKANAKKSMVFPYKQSQQERVPSKSFCKDVFHSIQKACCMCNNA